MDEITNKILEVIKNSEEPLETKEIVRELDETRTKILYRLRELRGEGLIRGKIVGAGKGTWIWWKKDAFINCEHSGSETLDE